jgi:hypothetical protein
VEKTMTETANPAFAFDQRRIEDAIIAEVSHKIIGDDDLYRRVTNAVDARIEKHFKEVADQQIRSSIELAIAAGFEREYQKVDTFGGPQGAKTTIRAELERLIAGYWNCRVGKDGKPTDSTYSTVTRAEWMMAQLVAADFQGEMKQHVVNLGGTFKDKLRGELNETLNRLLSEVFHVRSRDDQANNANGRSIIDPVAK